MTQIQTMTNPEINRALAELMGYTVYHYDKDVEERCYYMLMDPEFDPYVTDPFAQAKVTEAAAWADGPDYCTDPAASLEVQTAAYAASPEWYLHHLAMRTNKEDLTLEEFPDPFEVYGPELVGPMVTADPRERAEAAYITLSSKQ